MATSPAPPLRSVRRAFPSTAPSRGASPSTMPFPPSHRGKAPSPHTLSGPVVWHDLRRLCTLLHLGWRYQPACLGPLQRPPRPTGPLLREGYHVPPIFAMRPDPPVSTTPPDFPRSLVIQEAMPDDLVWAVADTFPALGQHSFHPCRHLYAGGRSRSISPMSPCSHGLTSILE